MPTRESHLKEPPYPKSKNYQPTKQDMMIDIEERNPVWLKDKGDHFFQKNDFKAAINAYTKAIENDKDFIKAYLNRATCLLLIRRPQETIKDCEKIEEIIKELKDSEKEDPFYKKVRVRATVKRAAAKAWLSMFQEAILDYKDALQQISASRRAYRPLESIVQEEEEQSEKNSALVEKKDDKEEEIKQKLQKEHKEKIMKLQEKMRKQEADLVSDHQISQIETDIELITRRMESQLEKEVGDAAFAEQDYNKALESYTRAAQIDPTNEYAFGNIALVHLKQLDYAQCIEYCGKALELIEGYMPHTKPFSIDNRLEVKLRLRRGLCFEKHDNYERAKEDLDRCVQQEPYNTEARGLLKRVQEKLNNKLFEKYRQEAVTLQNEAKQLTAAIQQYDKCLQIIERKVSRIEHVSVYASKASCLLGLQKYQESLNYSNDALRLLKNLTMRPGKKEKDEHDKAREMEFKILLVKSQGLSKLARDAEAVENLEIALKKANTERERKIVENLKKKL